VNIGAGSGIGRAVCQAFAREGARLAAVDLHEKGLAPVLSLPGKLTECLSLKFSSSFTLIVLNYCSRCLNSQKEA